MKSIINKFDRHVGDMIGRWPESWYGFLAVLCLVVGPLSWVMIAVLGTVLAVYLFNSYLAGLSLAVLVTLPLADLIKVIVRRPRPISMYVDSMKLRSYSFPSTHAYGAGLGTGYLIVFLAQYVSGLALYSLAGLLVAIALVVSLARVYLKAHFPSDVIAGLLLGGVVLLTLSQGLAVN